MCVSAGSLHSIYYWDDVSEHETLDRSCFAGREGHQQHSLPHASSSQVSLKVYFQLNITTMSIRLTPGSLLKALGHKLLYQILLTFKQSQIHHSFCRKRLEQRFNKYNSKGWSGLLYANLPLKAQSDSCSQADGRSVWTFVWERCWLFNPLAMVMHLLKLL